MIDVEVAYATPDKQVILPLRVPRGTTALDAARQSGIDKEFEGLELEGASMGIFSVKLDGNGRPWPHEYQLQPRDRVEIYRPLTIDPKQARLARAAKNKAP